MKRFVLSVFFLLLVSSFSHAQPVISFNHLSHDFATVGQEDKVEHVFEFANAGDQELVIEKVVAS